MRALANFVMRGRLYAAVLVLLNIPLLSSGVIALVALRKGAYEGALMAFVALIPFILSVIFGQSAAAALLVSLLGVLTVFIPAVCLRATTSWAFTVLASLVFSIVVVVISPVLVDFLVGFYNNIIDSYTKAAELEGVSIVPLPKADTVLVSGMLALMLLFGSLSALILARWWQAVLYNPNGFSAEFHQLRLGIMPSLVCLVLMLLCHYQGVSYGFWAMVFASPLILVAFAVIHNLARVRELNKGWLVAFYLLILINSTLLSILALVGFFDSWLNIRSRFSAPKK